MQPCNRIYYPTVHWRLNMFQAVFRSKHGEPSMNGGIINSITRLHLVGYFSWVILRCTDPWILNLTGALKHWKINTDPNKYFKIPAHVSEFLTHIFEKTILKSMLPISNYYQCTVTVFFLFSFLYITNDNEVNCTA
jgi:hypothetical protein